MSPPTGADVLVKSLEAQGVEYVFGIPGAKIDKVFDTLLDSTIKTVVCRHEQNAAFIAGGIGRMTGFKRFAMGTAPPIATTGSPSELAAGLGDPGQGSHRV
jgi:acetolactate synthase I/II/III large subunit